jgi:hypothetical protein
MLAIHRFVLLVCALLTCTGASAALFRAYLAIDGNDANPCTLQQPCRLLPAALAAVASGGEIWMLDSANYNSATVTITKSVTILAVPGVVGSVVAASGPAIAVGAAGLRIALRNLVIVPLAGGGGTDGVQVFAASYVSIEGCVIANIEGIGVAVAGDSTRARIGNTIFRNLGNTAIQSQDGATVDVYASQFIDVANGGVIVTSTGVLSASAYVSDSVFVGGYKGVQTFASMGGGGSARAAIQGSRLTNLDIALVASAVNGASSSISLGGTLVSGSPNPYQIFNGAIIYTKGDNHLFNNGAPIGSLTLAAPE